MLLEEVEDGEKHVDVMFLSSIDSDDGDDGNTQASEQLMDSSWMWFHRTVSMHVEDDREYWFEEGRVEKYEYSIEESV